MLHSEMFLSNSVDMMKKLIPDTAYSLHQGNFFIQGIDNKSFKDMHQISRQKFEIYILNVFLGCGSLSCRL